MPFLDVDPSKLHSSIRCSSALSRPTNAVLHVATRRRHFESTRSPHRVSLGLRGSQDYLRNMASERPSKFRQEIQQVSKSTSRSHAIVILFLGDIGFARDKSDVSNKGVNCPKTRGAVVATIQGKGLHVKTLRHNASRRDSSHITSRLKDRTIELIGGRSTPFLWTFRGTGMSYMINRYSTATPMQPRRILMLSTFHFLM